MRDPGEFYFELPAERRPPATPLAERWFPGATGPEAPWRRCTSPRRDDPISAVSVLVVHATAGVSTSGAFSVMREGRASFHWLVPDEDEAAHGRHVWATAPERRAAWHVRNSCRHKDINQGRPGINLVSLGVEIVNAQNAQRSQSAATDARAGGMDRFSLWQVAATAAIVRYAWAKYPNLRHVVSHARLDPARRTDPGPHFPWERFRDLTLGGVDHPQESGRDWRGASACLAGRSNGDAV
ncbi:MAG: N-acetylmuramoyl-L-alanine amidase [Alphaproteobacteria bacterium]|nr:N-acetylmuramoyl-L-alanine amidase [Alphaproteobacteria bacterium]